MVSAGVRKRRNTGSGHVELHVLSGASDYKEFIHQTPTALTAAAEDPNGDFGLTNFTS